MLDYLADTLGKPRRALFGLLAGRPGELANLIPFSDAMGLTDPSQQTRGKDLVGSDIGGFALDLLGDPVNWMAGMGALKLGQKMAQFGKSMTAGTGLAESGQALANAASAERAATAALGSDMSSLAGRVNALAGPDAQAMANWRELLAPGAKAAQPPSAATFGGMAAQARGSLVEPGMRSTQRLGFGRGGLLQDMTPDFIKPNPLGDEGLLQQLLSNTARPNLGLPTYY